MTHAKAASSRPAVSAWNSSRKSPAARSAWPEEGVGEQRKHLVAALRALHSRYRCDLVAVFLGDDLEAPAKLGKPGVKAVLTAISAKYKGEPCAAYMGPNGAGHFVKTIHNGIEYADMEMIAEIYGIMRDGLGMKAPEIAKVFGGSETDVDPALVELKKILPKVAAVGQPAAMPGLFQQGQCDVMYTNTQTVATLKGKGVDVEFVKPDTGAVAFYTTLHIAKGSTEIENAYKYCDTAVSKEVQEALTKAPYNFIPANKDVVMPDYLPMKSLDEFSTYVRHDWAKINPLRAAWIEKFNKEMAK